MKGTVLFILLAVVAFLLFTGKSLDDRRIIPEGVTDKLSNVTIGDVKEMGEGIVAYVTGEDPPAAEGCVVRVYFDGELLKEYEDVEACT